MRKLLKKYGFVPAKLITDDLRSYAAAASDLGIANCHERGRWRNNRAENSTKGGEFAGAVGNLHAPTGAHMSNERGGWCSALEASVPQSRAGRNSTQISLP